MRIISEKQNVIRVETGDGYHLDFDPDRSFGESDAQSHFEDMREDGRNPRMYRGTITTELVEE